MMQACFRPRGSFVAVKDAVLVLSYVDRCTVAAREWSSILLSTASTLVPMGCVVDKRSTAVLSR